jgi:UDP-N-acetylmuramyl tripeptide synthase
VVINADDLHLTRLADSIGPDVRVERYGVTAEVLAANPRGLGYARTAPSRLSAAEGMLLSGVDGRDARVLIGGSELNVRLPARGTHYAVDALTALAGARAGLGDRFDPVTAVGAISDIPPVFGRGEVVSVRGTTVEFVLVQNPASLQLNVDSVAAGTEQILVAVGSDVRDPSYLWPADTSALGRVLIASGSKAQDIALQLAYDGVSVDRIEPDLGRALDDFLALPEPAHGVKTIIFSADSMRRTRAHLGLETNESDPS